MVAANRLAGQRQLVRTKSHAVACFLVSTAISQPKGQAPCQLINKEPGGCQRIVGKEAFMCGSVQRTFEGEVTGALWACCIEKEYRLDGTITWGVCRQSGKVLQTRRAVWNIIV